MSPYDRFINTLAPGETPGNVMLTIQREFNDLHARLEAMENKLNVLRTRISITGDDFWVGPRGMPYTADQVKSPDEQRMSIERFKQAFGQKVIDDLTLCMPAPTPPKPIKEEAHPATQTSFVLKI